MNVNKTAVTRLALLSLFQFFLVFFFSASAQQPPFVMYLHDINGQGVSTNNNTVSINTYDKLEMTLYLVNTPSLGVYNVQQYFSDPDYINLFCELTSPTGIKYKVDGFYYEDYQVSCILPPAPNHYHYNTVQSNSGPLAIVIPPALAAMVQVDNISIWKIRFTPQEAGTWNFSLTTIFDAYNTYGLNNTIHYTPPPNSEEQPVFSCNYMESKGFVKRGTNNKYLQFENGDQLFLIGENMEWMANDNLAVNENAPVHPNNIVTKPAPQVCGSCVFERLFDELADGAIAGRSNSDINDRGNYIRFGLGTLPYPANPPSNSMTAAFMKRNTAHVNNIEYLMLKGYDYDKIFEAAAQRNIFMKVSLMKPFYNPSEYPGNIFRAPNDPPSDPCDFFDQSTAVSGPMNKRYRDFLRYVIARWGYATNVVAWEIVDEWDDKTESNNGQKCIDKIQAAMANWFDVTAKYIREKDFNRHLIDAGCEGVWFPDNIANNPVLSVYGNDEIDLTGNHFSFGYSPNIAHFNNGCYTAVDGFETSASDAETRHFTRSKILQRDFYKKPYIMNSFWFGDNNLKNDFLRYGFYHHNSYWMSIFSGSYGMSSNWSWGYLHAPFVGNNWAEFPLLSHMEAIHDFVQLMDKTTEPMESFSNIDVPLTEVTIKDNSNMTLNDIRVVIERNTGKTRFYGWLQDIRYDQKNLLGLPNVSTLPDPINQPGVNPPYSFASSFSCYQYTLDPAYRPSPNLSGVSNKRFLALSVTHNLQYRVEWYGIGSQGLIHIPNSPSNLVATASGGVVKFPIPELDGVYGDLCFRVFLDAVPEENSACSSILDLVRIGDTDGDGIDNLVLNNRCTSNPGAFKILNAANGNTIKQIDHVGAKFEDLMDNEDKLFVRNVSDIHPGDEIILFNKTTGAGRDRITVINPSNGAFISSPSITSQYGGSAFLGTEDQALMGDIDGDKKEELILINYDPASNANAIVVLNPVNGRIRYLYTYTIDLLGWLDSGDKSYMADINGDGKEELVLFNTLASPNSGAITAIDLTFGTAIFKLATMTHGASGGDFSGWLDACDRIFVADVNNNQKEEIILVNTSMVNGQGAFWVIDLSTQQTVQSIQHTGNNFQGWMDTPDKMMVGDFDGIAGQDLLMINTKYGNTAGAIRIVNFVNASWPIQINYGSTNQFAQWFGSNDIQTSAWKVDGLTNKDFLVLVNRGANSGNNEDIFTVMDFSQLAPMNVYTQSFSSSYETYWFNGTLALNCDGSVSPAGGGNEVQSQQRISTSAKPAHALASELSIYPNPYTGNTDELMIALNNAEGSKHYDVKIYDATMHVVYEGRFSGRKHSIKASQLSLSNGVYFVSVNNAEGIQIGNSKWMVIK